MTIKIKKDVPALDSGVNMLDILNSSSSIICSVNFYLQIRHRNGIVSDTADPYQDNKMLLIGFETKDYLQLRQISKNIPKVEYIYEKLDPLIPKVFNNE
ncbi:19001_t:CDS:2 [Funneliformis geosporum]|nr:19001_t:CDS:2 [Funneliformis geosporum]